jgi:hypothetical protein
MHNYLACQSVPVLHLLEAPSWLVGRSDELERAIEEKGRKRHHQALSKLCWVMDGTVVGYSVCGRVAKGIGMPYLLHIRG